MVSDDDEDEDDDLESEDDLQDVEEEYKEEKGSKEPERPIPEAWDCKINDVKVGDFVVLEVTYTAVKERGIRVKPCK